MSDPEGLIRYFNKKQQQIMKPWQAIVIAEIIGDKITEKLPTPPVTKPPIIEVPTPPTEVAKPPITEEILKKLKLEIPKIEVPKVEIPTPYSILKDRKDYTIHTTGDWQFSIKGIGTLTEFTIIASSDNFNVQLKWDGIPDNLLNDSYTGYSSYSLNVDELMAFEDNGSYVFGIRNISFLESLSLKVTVDEDITFDKIRLKVDMIKEV